MRHGVPLVFPKLNFGVHSRKNDVAAVVLTGANGVEFLVVDTAKLLSAGWVRPNPILEALLDQFLFCLCDRRFLFVQDGFLFAIGVFHIVVDTDIFQIQGFLDNAVSIDAELRTVDGRFIKGWSEDLEESLSDIYTFQKRRAVSESGTYFLHFTVYCYKDGVLLDEVTKDSKTATYVR